ncbi:MAG: hypothetical protein ACTSV7_09235 [Candidatus Baldrarchaeia archaeon]
MKGLKFDCKTKKLEFTEDKDIKIEINELELMEVESLIQQKLREIALRELKKEGIIKNEKI